MCELRDSGTTILFVSHSTQQVRDFCTEAALLHKGRLVSRGDTREVVNHYHSLFQADAVQRRNEPNLDRASGYGRTQGSEQDLETAHLKGNIALNNQGSSLRNDTGDVRIQNVEILDEQGRPVDVVAPESYLTARVHVQYLNTLEDSAVEIVLRNRAGLAVFSTNTTLEQSPVGSRRAGELVIVEFVFQVLLKHGRYNIAAAVTHSESEDSHLNWMDAASDFRVSRPSGRGAVVGLVRLPTRVKVFEPDRMQ
jgi:ABC-2 type transport system ATP-binding protein